MENTEIWLADARNCFKQSDIHVSIAAELPIAA